MGEIFNSLSLTGVAAAIARCMGAEPPKMAGEALVPLCGMAERVFKGRKAGRALLIHPDAVGMRLYQQYTADFMPVLAHTQLALPLLSVCPPKTPVCFASMFSGALPEAHGIRKYEKPVLAIDTLFDALARSGKRAAIVAVEECSMAKIFLGRDIDYFILKDDEEVTEKAVELIRRDEHDFLSVYHPEYDSLMHKIDPDSSAALQAMRNRIAAFARLAEEAERCWEGHDTLIGFAPDHGNHRCAEGNGEHGEAIPEDLNIMHFYGFNAKV